MLLRSVILGCLAAPFIACGGKAQKVDLPSGVDELQARAYADSNDALAHYDVALGYWNEGRFEDVERALREALAIDPQLAEAYLGLAYLPFASHPDLWPLVIINRIPPEREALIRESAFNYRRAFRIDPFVDLNVTGLAPPPQPSDTSTLPRWYEPWQQRFSDLRRGNYKEAYVQLGRLIKRLQKDRDKGKERNYEDFSGIPGIVLWHHGLLAGHVASYEEAAFDLQLLLDRSTKPDPVDSLLPLPLLPADLLFLMARMEHEAGNINRAADLYHAALAEDAELYMAHTQLARIYELAGRWDDAIEECRRSIAANPTESTLFLHLGVTLGKANRLKPAADALRRAAELNPRDTRAFYLLGLVQLERRDRQAARDAFNRFLQLAPGRLEEERADARHRLESLR